MTNTESRDAALLPDRHPQQELFICDVADAVLKDDMASMEHPIFTLSKKPDTAIREYEHNGNTLTVTPSVKGLATIYDKDILIYAISQLMAAKAAGDAISRKISVSARQVLIFTNRDTGGRNYGLLEDALDRLTGTRLRTNIMTGGERVERWFGLVDEADVKRDERTGRVVELRITLSDWLYNAINADEVLTLHRDYFRLRKPLERRVYEIARKHCGNQKDWKISLALLAKKCGTRSPMKHFRYLMRDLVECDHLPDYAVSLDEDSDMVIFTNRAEAEKIDVATGGFQISGEGFAEAKSHAPGWDIYYLEQEWRSWVAKMMADGMGGPRDADAAFVGFCKKWFEKRGRPK